MVEVLVEAQARRRAPQQARQSGLAHRERVAPQIVAVEFDQVEGIEEHARVVALVPDAVERRDPVVTTGDRLAVDDAGPRMQCGERLDDEREAVGQVITRPTVEFHPLAVLAGNHAKSVVLDLMQPHLAGRRMRSVGWLGLLPPLSMEHAL